MIDVYFWPTGNGKKITIMLEECGLPYNVIPVNINKGDQSTPKRWFETVGDRPAVRRGADVGKDLASFSQSMSDKDLKGARP